MDDEQVDDEQEHEHEQHRFHRAPDKGQLQLGHERDAADDHAEHEISAVSGRNEDGDHGDEHGADLRARIHAVNDGIQRQIAPQSDVIHDASPHLRLLQPDQTRRADRSKDETHGHSAPRAGG